MANAKAGNITELTRGGQVFHHYIKMLWEVTSKLIGFVVFISFLIFTVSMCFLATKSELLSAANYFQSWWVYSLSNATKANIFYFTDWFNVKMIAASRVYFHEGVQIQTSEFVRDMYTSLIISTCFFIVFFILTITFLRKRGDDLNDETYLRGSQLVESDEAKKYMGKLSKETKMGDLTIGEIPIPFDWEPQSFLVVGAPGTGKSVLTEKWIEQARKGNKKALIFDRSGGFIQKFYDPSKDVIINPYDVRSAKWNIFKECTADYHYTYIANTLITKSDKDSPFWPLAARLVFKSLLMKEAVSANPSMESLMDIIMKCTLEEMVEVCKGTDAASVFDKEGLKMATTIRSVIASEVEILRVMDGKNADFSMREWVKNDHEGFIFISTLKEQEEALKPFFTLLCDLFMISVLTLSPDRQRRIWAFLDEAQALGKLQTLPMYLAESRKYGGATLVGFQGYSQAKRIYGDEGVEELSDLFATFSVMRCNGNKTADWCAKQLGKTDNIEVNESLSYGLNSARDGANLQNSRRERDIVLPAELQNLPDLNGYVKFGREVPVAKFTETYVSRKSIAEAFILDDELTKRQINNMASSVIVEDDEYFGAVNGDVESSLHDSANEITELSKESDVDKFQGFENGSFSDVNDLHDTEAFQLTDTFSDMDMDRD